jgi:hypothetical protein
MRPVPPDQMQDNNPSQTYQNQENRSFSNSYGNSYNNSMSGYQPQYGSRGGFGMQQPMYGGGMGIMGLQSPFGGYGMQSPFGSYGGGMQQPMYGGGMQSPFGSYGMQQPMYGGMQQGYGMQSPYGGYGMQQPQYQSSPFSPQFGGGIRQYVPWLWVADTAVDTDNLLNTAAVMDSNLVMAVDTAVAMVADIKTYLQQNTA